MRKIAAAVVVVAFVAVAILGYAAFAPPGYSVERSALLGASPPTVVTEIADLQRWAAWSPDEARDPRMTRGYGGKAGSPGASYYWSGTGTVGKGRATVTGVGPDRVEVEVELERPRPSSADMEFRIVPEGTSTRVTWTVQGENGLVDRFLWLFAGRRTALLASMEERLGQLRKVTEAMPRVQVHRLAASTVVAAPPAAVHARIADLRGWSGWSPWKGPASGKASYGGAASGVGSSAYWKAGEADGPGRLTVVAATPETVELEIEAGAPRAASNDLEFQISPEGKGARVTWTMTGDGGLEVADLERSLARLKALAEGRVR